MGRKKMPSVKLEMLTPKMAKKMLTLDKRNRKRDMVKVRKYAKDMERGTFLLTSIGIGVDINNEITNGGHRLDACVLANVPVSIIVARNLPPEARNHVDTGKNRSFANSLEMSNLCCTRSNDTNKVIGKGNYTKMVASTVSYIILHQTGNFDRLGSVSGLISNQEVVDFVSNNEEELTNSGKSVV